MAVKEVNVPCAYKAHFQGNIPGVAYEGTSSSSAASLMIIFQLFHIALWKTMIQLLNEAVSNRCYDMVTYAR